MFYKRDFHSQRKQLEEARRIKPPTNMDSDVVRAAQTILQDKDGIEQTHTENAFQKLIDQTNALTQEMEPKSEASARLHMAWLSMQDALEAWESEKGTD